MKVGTDAIEVVEDLASGRGIERTVLLESPHAKDRDALVSQAGKTVTAKVTVEAARAGNRHARWAIERRTQSPGLWNLQCDRTTLPAPDRNWRRRLADG